MTTMGVFTLVWLVIGTLLFCGTSLLLGVAAQEPQVNGNDASSSKSHYYISQPKFTQTRLDLFLEYAVSNGVPYENLGVALFDGQTCGGDNNNDITNNNYLNVDVNPADTLPLGDGSTLRNVTLAITFNPDTIEASPIFYSNLNNPSLLNSQIKLCIRLSAYTADVINPGAYRVYSRDTYITLNVKQDGFFDIENLAIVTDTTSGDIDIRPQYYLIGYICDKNNEEIINPEPMYQGEIVKVCVTPNEEALQNNVYMRSIDSFSWTRESIYQPAIFDRQVLAPLTDINCIPGMEICSFRTTFKNAFFYKAGEAKGFGIGWLQFGREAPQQDLNDLGLGSTAFAGIGTLEVTVPVARFYTAIGFLCDQDNKELDPNKNPFAQGGVARVCVKPSLLALGEGVTIRSIDSFTWTRQEFNVTQPAITVNGRPAAPDTELFCNPGQTICSFQTKLSNQFFGTPGKVDGKGIVWLQFGQQNPQRVDFQLEYFGTQQQNILMNQMEPGFAGGSPFQIYIYVIQEASIRELYLCRAYQCDEENREFVTSDSLFQNATVRICVAPFDQAQANGVKMWRVEWWDWQRKNFTQQAIVPHGQEAPNGLTIQKCDRGDQVCSFRSHLRNEFFNDSGVMTGVGDCWLTFGDSFPIKGRIASENPGGEDDVEDPTDDPLYAGGGEISLAFQVTGDYSARLEICPPVDHQLKVWWEQDTSGMKSVYIFIMVATASSVCCMLGLCFICGFRRDDEEVEKKGGGGEVVVNVDIEDIQKTENHYNQHSEVHQESNLDLGSSATDVYFGLDSHPGTRAFQKIIRQCMREAGSNASFDPNVYDIILKRAGKDCRFFTRDDESSSEWIKPSKQELIRLVGQCWRKEKYKKN